MKINKIYYYSSEKQKLVNVENVFSKAALFIIFIVFLTATITFFTSSKIVLNYSSNNDRLKNFTDDNLLENEFELLQKKYIALSSKLDKLADESSNLRIAVNLPELNQDYKNYGIGGSEFESEFASVKRNNLKLSSILDVVNKIETGLKIERINFGEIENKYKENQNLYKTIPAVRPVNCPIGDRFGMRLHPILMQNKMHYGLDFIANIGEKVYAPGSGKITFVGQLGGYGKVIKITHGFGYETLYGHLSEFNVKIGQTVKRGELIALSGNTGTLTTGPHLHYEVRHKGVSLNPRNFIFEDLEIFNEI
ncbi:MAG: M23 family metallopeptidase [Ignavibacteriae bacterium]|nr:M23 family metallopeptidase [Ignavibacteriota bacterium]